MYDAKLLPVYSAGFIDLNKQYLTIGLNGLNQAAEYIGIKCDDNEEYQKFCQNIFSLIKEQNTLHKTKKTTFNTEQVPAESLAIKNYNWDKADKYWTPEDTNLYASYIFKPNENLSVLEKLRLHGKNYIGEYLDGGAAAHINLSEHLSKEQYKYLLKYAAEVGCQYFTFNIPNSECDECGYITKYPITKCPKCGNTKISLWDRVIGYLTKIKNWSDGRQLEQKTRVYNNSKCINDA
jgi:ribonucleoside-triphosphate reductase